MNIFLGNPPESIRQWIEDHYGKRYLTIEPLSSTTPDADKTSIMLLNSSGMPQTGTFEARLNDGDWTTISWNNVSPYAIDYNLVKACDASKETISYGEKLQIRGLDRWAQEYSLKVTCAGGAKVSGKMADSLTPEYAASTASYKLASFFKGSTGLKDASELDLGGITITSNCCLQMFQYCTSLVNAPQLPATALATNCYTYMFQGCTSLTKAPALPATTLASECYNSMFHGCTSLTQAPTLPATTLANYCYYSMFSSCTSLTQAPALPATALAENCYSQMFSGCTNLTQAPELPATALAGSCYYAMFSNCTKLTQAPALPATTFADECYSSMFNSCTKVTELHYPASIQNDSTFTGMPGTPWFGATNATVHYDL